MYYQFQGVQEANRASESHGQDDQDSKPTKSPHACAECQRRKIRCDGKQPCRQCISSRPRKRCFYDKHRKRLLPSRKTLQDLSQSLEECHTVLGRLYPGHDVTSLVKLSRQELCSLLKLPAADSAESLPSPSLSLQDGSLNLEQMPTPESEWDEERRNRDPIPAEADDINALSLTMDSQASYLGASSIKAAFMVMLKIQPQLRTTLTSPPNRSSEDRSAILRQPIESTKESSPISWTWKGQTFVDAYFKCLHLFTPMLDEVSFRADYLKGQRNDAPWLALLNMVFAMGSIMATTSKDLNHIYYSHQAMGHLNLSALGSSHIETVQALTLLGGHYLHYINRPNMGNAIMGATIRMASALGLHRESVMQNNSDAATIETRRRTWWSIFCLDTWATTTMGRPSFGRWGPAINIEPPRLKTTQEEDDSAQHSGIMPLLENIKFCKIATQVQDMLAVFPLLETSDRDHLDRKLVNWYNDLPRLLRTNEPCTEPLSLSRCCMRWRYWNLRLLLYRPILLTLASNGKVAVAEQDLAAIETCRELAKTTIEDVADQWLRHTMSGWNAVWFLYQAAMVPLISTLWQPESPCRADWQKQIETILGVFDAIEDWSLTARRSADVVRRIYQASRQNPAPIDSAPQVWGEEISQAEGDSNISPFGFEMDDVVNMLDQDWLWDVDGLLWEQETAPVAEDDFGYEMPHDSV
ncbi:fungal-specific transcription factor [Thelonectria olida]|uniref:Fungal-specific transcription factor n=1 Tax=Thelonectria olida TaxID=1576542 RepID=A0A9P8W4N6_9HYPO|nr:fungal-specific transcription factor [Thelonectria olida]